MQPTNRHFITALFIFIALSAANCGGGGGSGGGTSTPPYIYAEIVSFPSGQSSASVYVIDDSSGDPITNAVVTMNNVTLNYSATYQVYEGSPVITPGAIVALSVTVGDNTYTASGTQFTSYPTISAPVSGDTWHAAYAGYVTWSGGAPFDNAFVYGLGVLDAENGELIWPPNNVFQTVSKSNTSYTIPANSLTVGNYFVIVGIAAAISVPDAAPGSEIVISGFNYAPVTVADASLTSISVSPSNPSVPSGLSQQFTATGTFSDNTTQNLTGQVTWVSSNTNSVQFKYYNPGLAYCWGGGTSTISATWESFSDSTTLTVTPAILMSFYSISPLNSIISKGITQQFTALGTFSDGGARDITTLVNWSSSDESIATISNAAGSNGTAAGLGSGTTTITATSGSLSSSTALTVTKWTFANSGTTLDLRGIAWSGTQLLAVGDANTNTGNATMLTSPDGVTWTTQKPGWGYLYGVYWLGSEFGAVGQGGTIITSSTGVSWTSHPTDTSNPLCGLAWSGTQYVATGSLLVLSSPDKAVWTSRVPGLTNTQNDVVWSGTQFLTVGYGGKIFTSTDGISWTQQISGTTNSLNGVVWSGTQFVVVGENGTVLTSPDGAVWSSQTSGISKTLNHIAWSGKEFFAVGGSYGSGVVITSPDAVTWTEPVLGTVSPLRTLYGVASFGTRFAAVGERGTILISP